MVAFIFCILFFQYLPLVLPQAVSVFTIQCLYNLCPGCNSWKPRTVVHRHCTRNELSLWSKSICSCRYGYCGYASGNEAVCCSNTPHDVCRLSEWSMSADHCNGIACERGYESKFIGEKCVCCRKSWYKACSEASSWPLQCPTGYSKETHLGLVKCWKDTPIEQNEHCTADEWRREACSDSICPAGYSCRHFMGQPKCCKQTKAITAADFGVCPHTGLPSSKVCRSDQDCGDCRFTCQNHLCCQRTDTYANNTVAVPTGSCGDEGTCVGGGHVCMDRLCYPIAVVVHSPEGFCPGGFKSQIFCPGNCCPYGMQCVNKVCCK